MNHNQEGVGHVEGGKNAAVGKKWTRGESPKSAEKTTAGMLAVHVYGLMPVVAKVSQKGADLGHAYGDREENPSKQVSAVWEQHCVHVHSARLTGLCK